MTTDGGFAADEPQSFVLITAAGIGVFCGGDTSLSDDLRTWGELYRVGIAVLGIGGLWLGAGKIIGLHPADPAPAQLAADLTGSAINVVSLDFGDMDVGVTAPCRSSGVG